MQILKEGLDYAKGFVAMTNEPSLSDAESNLRSFAEKEAQVVKEKSAELYHNVKSKGEDAAACADEYIRKRPLPVVAGALVFGLAIGYLASASRREPACLCSRLRGHLDDATDQARDLIPADILGDLSSGLSRFTHHLKFW